MPRLPAAVVGLLAAALMAFGCTGTHTPPPAPPPRPAPAAIPDSQPAVDAPLYLGQAAFANVLDDQGDFSPSLDTTRVDGANSGVVDGPAPLGKAPVSGSVALNLQAPLLWSHDGLVVGCHGPSIDHGADCLASVDPATLAVTGRWSPPTGGLNLAATVVDSSDHFVVPTPEGRIFVVARSGGTTGSFQVLRDIDLSSKLGAGVGVGFAVPDSQGNIWFASGGPARSATSGPPATGGPAGTVANGTGTGAGAGSGAEGAARAGFVTTSGQVAILTVAGQAVPTAPAVDGTDVYFVTSPAPGADRSEGELYDLRAAQPSGSAGPQVQVAWREPYDAGTALKPGATVRGSGGPVVLVGSQYLAITDNAAAQTDLLVFQRGDVPSPGSSTTGAVATSTTAATTTPATTTTATGPPARTKGDARLVCRVGLFTAGASAVTTAAVAYSAGGNDSVLVANGYNTPAAPLDSSDNGPGNDLDQMPGGLTRVDVLSDGSGCRTQWSAPLRLPSAPVLATATGLVYGYTEDSVRAASGSYVWYFVAVDYRTGQVIWQQRAGAGSTKNSAGLPTAVGGNGVLYQAVPLGLVWMHDVGVSP